MSAGSKILIIEDEFLIAAQIKQLLEEECYKVVGPVDNYEESIKLINQELPDLVLTDIRLHDDRDAGIRISNYLSNYYTIPLIFLSSYSDKATLQKAKDTHPITFLIKPKPLDKEQLLTSILISLPRKIDNHPKLKAIFLKGKEIEIKESYDHIKTHERIDSVILKIEVDTISFIETFNHHFKNNLLIRFTNKKNGFLIRLEFQQLQKMLPNYFIKVHKSYVVNMKNITSYKLPHNLFFKNYCIPIGDKYRKKVEEYLCKQML